MNKLKEKKHHESSRKVEKNGKRKELNLQDPINHKN